MDTCNSKDLRISARAGRSKGRVVPSSVAACARVLAILGAGELPKAHPKGISAASDRKMGRPTSMAAMDLKDLSSAVADRSSLADPWDHASSHNSVAKAHSRDLADLAAVTIIASTISTIVETDHNPMVATANNQGSKDKVNSVVRALNVRIPSSSINRHPDVETPHGTVNRKEVTQRWDPEWKAITFR